MGPILLRVGIGVVLATVVVLLVGFLLPSEYALSRSTVIQADPARIHELVGDLEQWERWAPWFKGDPSVEVTYGALTSGVGATQIWTAESGSGQLVLTRCEPDWGIAYDMSFADGSKRAQCSMHYVPAAEGVEVIWDMAGDNGKNPIARYFGLVMGSLVGPMFDDGLVRLKMVAETENEAAGSETTAQ